MTEQATCPDSACWKGLLEGTVSDCHQAALNEHLETCTRCQRTLEGLAAGPAVWSGATRYLREGQLADEEILRVLADLEAEPDKFTTGATTSDVELPLDILDPPEKPELLGHLGHYDVLGVLGRGATSVVFKAIDRTLHRVVAIKVMSRHLAANGTARTRFVREARAAAAVRNEHVVAIYSVEEVKGLPYLVMECVAGSSLQQRLDRGGPLELKEILRIGMQTAAGLAAAHAQGVIHRDIKPANILLENGVERVKITDFGLARVAADASLTQSGVVAGTPHYMAPEQARGERLDERADLFSLGSVLYALCTGRLPFRAHGTLAVLKRVAEDSPPAINAINPDIPDWFLAIIGRLHAKDPAQRFQTAAEVTALLGRHLARLQQAEAAGSLVANSPSPRKSVARVRWVAAAALLALIGGLGLTEAAGVTGMTTTMIRVFTPDGILRIEVDDPSVKVSLEGDGGLVITGTGFQEVRLRPGSYRLKASKDGKLMCEELVTIQRGGLQVVKVSREADAAVAVGPAASVPSHPFAGHTSPILCLAISSDSRQALSGSADSTVRLWELASGRELQCFRGHADEVTAVAFSPDGEQVVSAGKDRSIRRWDVRTGNCLQRQSGHTDTVRSVALDGANRFIVSGSHDGTVRLWDTTGGEVRSFVGHQGWVTSVAISRDGRWILSGGYDRTVRVWSLQSGKELRRLEGHTREVYAVGFSPDGSRAVSGGNDGTVLLWDTVSGHQVKTLVGHHNAVVCVAFAPDGRQVFSASSQYQNVDRTLRVWDVASGRELRGYGGEAADRIGCAAFSPDGRVALSGSSDPTLRCWKLSK